MGAKIHAMGQRRKIYIRGSRSNWLGGRRVILSKKSFEIFIFLFLLVMIFLIFFFFWQNFNRFPKLCFRYFYLAKKEKTALSGIMAIHLITHCEILSDRLSRAPFS